VGEFFLFALSRKFRDRKSTTKIRRLYARTDGFVTQPSATASQPSCRCAAGARPIVLAPRLLIVCLSGYSMFYKFNDVTSQ